MTDHEPAIRQFFVAYETRINDALKNPPVVDAAAAAGAFADYVVGSDPQRVSGHRNGLLFRMMIPRGYRSYRKAGTKRMEIRGLRVTPLDDSHAMAHTHWWSLYLAKTGKVVEIEFDNIYMMHVPDAGAPKIFAYITGDEQKLLKAHGLVE